MYKGPLPEITPSMCADLCFLNEDESEIPDQPYVDPNARSAEETALFIDRMNQEYGLSASFVRMMKSPRLQWCVPSCTSSYFDLDIPPLLIGDVHYLLFYRDQQDCIGWYLVLDGEDKGCVVASQIVQLHAYGGDVDATSFQEQSVICAASFDEFVYRMWVENHLWFNKSKPARIVAAYEAYAQDYSVGVTFSKSHGRTAPARKPKQQEKALGIQRNRRNGQLRGLSGDFLSGDIHRPKRQRIRHTDNTSALRTFKTLASIREFHNFLVGPFYDAVYGATSFDGDTAFPAGQLYTGPGFLGGYGRILGTIRIGQLRVNGTTCDGFIAQMADFFTQPATCYPEYSTSTESLAPFGYPNQSVYFPRTSMPSEPFFVARSARYYGSPRFTIEFPSVEPSESCDVVARPNCTVYDQLVSLREHKFVDLATRAIFIDLTTYNPNSDEQTSIRLFVELTKGGGFTPQVECTSYRLYRNTTASDTIRFVLEILVLILVAIQLRQEAQLIRRLKWSYLKMVANFSHLLSLVIFLPMILFRVLSTTNLPDLTSLSLTTFINFRTSMWYFTMADAVTSFTFFLSWLKLFKFLAFLPMFAPLTQTVNKSMKQVTGLILIFGVALMGSSLSFTMAFGLDAETHKSFADSCLYRDQK
ncbi:unnamed protein product [Aphanomyces euteiches]